MKEFFSLFFSTLFSILLIIAAPFIGIVLLAWWIVAGFLMAFFPKANLFPIGRMYRTASRWMRIHTGEDLSSYGVFFSIFFYCFTKGIGIFKSIFFVDTLIFVFNYQKFSFNLRRSGYNPSASSFAYLRDRVFGFPPKSTVTRLPPPEVSMTVPSPKAA